MTEAYLLTFDILPLNNNETQIIKPFDYLFRGVIMKWLKEINPIITQHLHSTDLGGGEKMLRQYSIQHEFFSKKTQQSCTCSGIRFHLNVFQADMMQTIVKHFTERNSKTIQLGEQKCLISQINIESITLESLFDSAKPTSVMDLNFKTPTAFKQMRNKNYIYQPLPEKIFGNLAKLWTKIIENPQYQLPEDFYDWVIKHIQLIKTETRIHSWKMGVRKPNFKGFVGWARIQCPNEERTIMYSKWISCLLKFGELTNVGSGRTAGFGCFKHVSKK